MVLSMLPTQAEIKSRRIKIGLTQTELAEKAGVSQSLIAKIETGQIDAAYTYLKKIFDTLEELENQTQPKASDVMNSNVNFVSKKDSVASAIALMRKHNFSQLPVLDRGHAVGSVSEKSILDRISSGLDAHELSKLECGEIMEEAFPVVSETTPLPAISELLKHHFAVLVRKGGKIGGIISKADLLKTIH